LWLHSITIPQAIGAETNSNLILLPNSPQAGSEMLNNMVASFTASNMVGESMKRGNAKTKAKTILPLTDKENQQDDNPEIEE
jgi:hypothetical protein